MRLDRSFFFAFFLLIATLPAKSFAAQGQVSATVDCPKGSSPKVYRRGNDIKVVCTLKNGRQVRSTKRVKRYVAPNPKPARQTSNYDQAYSFNNSSSSSSTSMSSSTEKITSDKVVQRHYYIPVQQQVDNQYMEKKEEAVKKEPSIIDSFEGLHLGLMYHVSPMTVNNKAIFTCSANGCSQSNKYSDTATQHGPVVFLNYSSFIGSSRMLWISGEIRMPFSILNSADFSDKNYSGAFGSSSLKYNYHSAISSVFMYPSINARLGVRLGERVLPYGIVGLQIYKVSYENAPQLVSSSSSVSGYIPVDSSSATIPGYYVGGGVQFALTKIVHFRIEGLFYGAASGSESFSGTHTTTVGQTTTTANNSLDYKYQLSGYSIMAGLSIKLF